MSNWLIAETNIRWIFYLPSFFDSEVMSTEDVKVTSSPGTIQEGDKTPSGELLPPRKRCAAIAAAQTNDDDDDSTKGDKKAKIETVDISVSLGFKAGDRMEVEWEVAEDEEGDEMKTRWWGCTLKAYDGRTTSEGLAIRVLDYDPYPEGGFPNNSLEDVVFATPNTLVHPDSLEQQPDMIEELHFRREGEDETVIMNDESLRGHLNELLVDIMNEKQITSAFRNMDAAQQAQFAELVANGKEKLIEVIQTQWDQTRKVITPEDIPGIMEQAFGFKGKPK